MCDTTRFFVLRSMITFPAVEIVSHFVVTANMLSDVLACWKNEIAAGQNAGQHVCRRENCCRLMIRQFQGTKCLRHFLLYIHSQLVSGTFCSVYDGNKAVRRQAAHQSP